MTTIALILSTLFAIAVRVKILLSPQRVTNYPKITDLWGVKESTMAEWWICLKCKRAIRCGDARNPWKALNEGGLNKFLEYLRDKKIQCAKAICPNCKRRKAS